MIAFNDAAPTQPRLGAPYEIAFGDPAYPERLTDLRHPPRSIWGLGDLSLVDHRPIVAVVGTRNATAYGTRVTRDLVTALGRAGACIVSGMARGIDSIGHQAAIECGAPTIAVLGTGVDVAYPAGNRPLHRRIATVGLVLSQYPPGARAHGGSFLERNHLIAALASVTIVVEAGVKSGALKTAEFADDIGRTVALVPGPIDSPQSLGANNRLRESDAHLIASIDDALSLVGLSRGAPLHVPIESVAQQKVWDALASVAPSLDIVCARAGLPARECLEAVTALELRGAVECALTGEVRRRA
jgi:DNA processing protein